MKLKDCLAGGAVVVGKTALISGISTGFGAASGAIGWSILRAAGWNSVSFGYTEMVSANALGAGILAIIPSLFATLCLLGLEDKGKAASGMGACALLYVGLTGAVNSLLGSLILGYLDTGSQVGFAAAAGAVGAGVLDVGLGTLGCIVACCGCVTYLCYKGVSNEVVMAKIPDEYVKKDGTIKEGIILPIEELKETTPSKIISPKSNTCWTSFKNMVAHRLGFEMDSQKTSELKAVSNYSVMQA